MHISILFSIPLAISSTLAVVNAQQRNYSPFATPAPMLEEMWDLRFRDMALVKRSCPAAYTTCANHAGACCSDDSVCTHDSNGNAACCASGATCTGTIASITTTGTGAVVATATTTTATTTGTDTAIPASCSSTYSSCAALFGASAYPVTIAGGGTGLTVAATATQASVCSSLFSSCTAAAATGGSAATATASFVVGSGAGRGGVGLQEMVLGFVVGLVGFL